MTRRWKQKNITYNSETDQHIIDYINKQMPNASQYVLGLIEKDMLISKATEEALQREFVEDVIYDVLRKESLK